MSANGLTMSSQVWFACTVYSVHWSPRHRCSPAISVPQLSSSLFSVMKMSCAIEFASATEAHVSPVLTVYGVPRQVDVAVGLWEGSRLILISSACTNLTHLLVGGEGVDAVAVIGYDVAGIEQELNAELNSSGDNIELPRFEPRIAASYLKRQSSHCPTDELRIPGRQKAAELL